jgi:ABC-type multidrug transport system permease subunit
MIAVGTVIGVIARSPDAVQGVVFMTVFPLTFLSNAFVPAASLPDGLRQIAEYNPVSAVAAAVRTLFGNPTAVPADAPWPLTHPVAAAVLWSVAFLAVAAPLCVWRFRRRTTE